jgi:hypothetical protein
MAARSRENIGALPKKTENFNIMRWLAYALTVAFLPGALHAQTFRVKYDLQSTEIPADQVDGLARFLTGGNSYFLVQGFACDTGGFAVSLRIAEQRSRKAHAFILRNVPEERLRFALPIVLAGEPRVDHRKLLVTAFATRAEVENALQAANEEQSKQHERYSPPRPVKEPARSPGLSPMLIATVLILALVAWLVYRQMALRKKRRRHQLSEPEAEMVKAITGEAPVIPQKNRRSSPHPSIQPHDIIDFRSMTMAAKKKTQKAGPTIRKALDKAFESKSLNEIAKSPVHALQGLTPRHSKMLEEAFGVKTVEDLAALRYFELARAITVLARYEE